MKNKLLIEVRDAIELHLKSLPQDTVFPSSPEIAEQFRKKNPDLIARAIEPLLDLVLTKLVSDVSTRKTHGSWTNVQNELFGKIGGIPNVIQIRIIAGKSKKSSLPTPSATFDQIMSWLDNKKTIRSRKSRHAQFTTLIKVLKPYFKNGHATLEDAMKAARSDSTKFRKASLAAGLQLELLSA